MVVVPSAMMFQSKPISFLQPQCFCKMHQEAFENGMDNLMTLDTIGESLSLQIKLSSHPDGVLYKDGWSNRDEPWFGCLGHRRVRSRNRWPTQLFLSLPLSGAVSNLTISCPPPSGDPLLGLCILISWPSHSGGGQVGKTASALGH